MLAAKVSRYEFAQTICTPGFYDLLPPMQSGLAGFYMADTSYYYPEDRSIAESVAVGRSLAGKGLVGIKADLKGNGRVFKDQGRFIGYVRVVGRRRGEAKLEEYCWPDTLRSRQVR